MLKDSETRTTHIYINRPNRKFRHLSEIRKIENIIRLINNKEK